MENIIYRIYKLTRGENEDDSKLLNQWFSWICYCWRFKRSWVWTRFTLDGTISIGATSGAATFVSDVTSEIDDAEVQAKFGNTAQSDIKSISI